MAQDYPVPMYLLMPKASFSSMAYTADGTATGCCFALPDSVDVSGLFDIISEII